MIDIEVSSAPEGSGSVGFSRRTRGPANACLAPDARLRRVRLGASIAGTSWPRLARALEVAFAGVSVAAHAVLLLTSAMLLAGGTYNPFIYWNF